MSPMHPSLLKGSVLLVLLAAMVASITAQAPTAAWDSVVSAIESNSEFNWGAMVVGSDDLGIVFNHTKANWNHRTKYIVASASKWISSTAIWVAIEQGKISVTDKVHQWIPWWTSDIGDERSEVTLGHLLSFTSGFTGDTCNGTVASLTVCVQAIYDGGLTYTPGTKFYYDGDHLQVAGLMTLFAVGETDWNVYFESSVLAPLGLSLSDGYFFPNSMPSLAGTLLTSADTYTKLLQAIYTNQPPTLLNMTTRALRETDWTAGIPSVYNPSFAISQNWHYACSFWVICPSLVFNSNCTNLHQYSSPGKFGYMPFIDRENDFWVLVSTYRNGGDAFADSTILLQSVLPTITQNVLNLREANGAPSSGETPEPNGSPSPALLTPSSTSHQSISALLMAMALVMAAVMA